MHRHIHTCVSSVCTTIKVSQQTKNNPQCYINIYRTCVWVGPGQSLTPERWKITLKLHLTAICIALWKKSESWNVAVAWKVSPMHINVWYLCSYNETSDGRHYPEGRSPFLQPCRLGSFLNRLTETNPLLKTTPPFNQLLYFWTNTNAKLANRSQRLPNSHECMWDAESDPVVSLPAFQTQQMATSYLVMTAGFFSFCIL